ncbi:hypothetical protein GCM10008967_32720 [Bacillus carboniphilus]|uniref:Uncharacterized protein n=1 Tax=Bacillus carboniphilus TaxID=86663 RepID=A0ABN0WJG3_9BACI
MAKANNGGPHQIQYSIWATKTDEKYKEQVQRYVKNRRKNEDNSNEDF